MKKFVSILLVGFVALFVSAFDANAQRLNREIIKITNVSTSATPSSATNSVNINGLVEGIRFDFAAGATQTVSVVTEDGTSLFGATAQTADAYYPVRQLICSTNGTAIASNYTQFAIVGKVIFNGSSCSSTGNDATAYIYFSPE